MKNLITFALMASLISITSMATARPIADGDDFCGSHKLPKALKNFIKSKTNGAVESTVEFDSLDDLYSFIANRSWTGYFYSQIFESGPITYNFQNYFSEVRSNRMGLDLEVLRDLSKIKVRSKNSCNRGRITRDLAKAVKAEARFLDENSSLPLSQVSLFEMDSSSIARGEFNINYVNRNLEIKKHRSTFNIFSLYSYTSPNNEVVDRLYFERHLLLGGRKYTIKHYLFSKR